MSEGCQRTVRVGILSLNTPTHRGSFTILCHRWFTSFLAGPRYPAFGAAGEEIFFFLWTLPTACYHYHSWIQTRHIKYDTGASISRGWIFISEQVEMKSRIRWWTILFPDLISIQKAKLKNGTKESLPGSANTDRKWLHKSFTASHLKPGVLMPQSIIYLLIDFSIKDGH